MTKVRHLTSDCQFTKLAQRLGTAHPLFTMLPWDHRYCIYCGHSFAAIQTQRTREHLIPKSRNGNNSPFNKRAACKPCNIEKGGLTPAEHIQLLENKLQTVSARKDQKKAEDLSIKIENAQAVLEYVNFAHDLLKQPIARKELSLTVYSETGTPMQALIRHNVQTFEYCATYAHSKTVVSAATIPEAIEKLAILH